MGLTEIRYLNVLIKKRKHAGNHPVTGEKLSWVKLENKNC